MGHPHPEATARDTDPVLHTHLPTQALVFALGNSPEGRGVLQVQGLLGDPGIPRERGHLGVDAVYGNPFPSAHTHKHTRPVLNVKLERQLSMA